MAAEVAGMELPIQDLDELARYCSQGIAERRFIIMIGLKALRLRCWTAPPALAGPNCQSTSRKCRSCNAMSVTEEGSARFVVAGLASEQQNCCATHQHQQTGSHAQAIIVQCKYDRTAARKQHGNERHSLGNGGKYSDRSSGSWGNNSLSSSRVAPAPDERAKNQAASSTKAYWQDRQHNPQHGQGEKNHSQGFMERFFSPAATSGNRLSAGPIRLEHAPRRAM